MEFIKHELNNVIEVVPNVFEDDRGYFFESYNKGIFSNNGIALDFVQDNQSKSQKDVLRGLHFQLPPYGMAKLVRVINGSIMDVIVDLRKNSSTYLKHRKIIVSADKKNMLFVPEGFAHGFLTLEDDTIVSYKCSRLYNNQADFGLKWDDTAFDIDWNVEHPLVSEKDKNAIAFKDFDNPF